MSVTLFTIGHSTHSIDRMLELLRQHSVQAVYDVRSHPHSRYNPQFNRELLQSSLERSAIRYVFLGDQLGARSKDAGHYSNGRVQFGLLAGSPGFQQGLEQVLAGAALETIVLLCSEKDPIVCHRAILVGRHLRSDRTTVNHILEDGAVETTAELETRLLRLHKLPERDLFTTRGQMIERAYDLQGQKIAHSID
jgi:uncharacterized protein (DUF488 family)